MVKHFAGAREPGNKRSKFQLTNFNVRRTITIVLKTGNYRPDHQIRLRTFRVSLSTSNIQALCQTSRLIGTTEISSSRTTLVTVVRRLMSQITTTVPTHITCPKHVFRLATWTSTPAMVVSTLYHRTLCLRIRAGLTISGTTRCSSTLRRRSRISSRLVTEGLPACLIIDLKLASQVSIRVVGH